MRWTPEHIEIEEIIDKNPELYIKRMEQYLTLKDYDGAVRECETYLKVGGSTDSYLKMKQMIQAIKTGKLTVYSEIEKIIIKIVKDVLDVDCVTVITTWSDLGADSLDAFEIVMGIEEAFDIEIETQEIYDFMKYTVRELAQWIAQHR